MGLGGTAKKLQKVADTAEELYKRLNELREQILALRQQVESTGEKVESVEADLKQQRVLLEALAEKEGLDVDELLAEAKAADAEQEAATTPAETPAESSD
ncbi:DUF5798 family protein [Haladaptatus sp. DJG-WS-42]|uniref:DUF5798 family protein n=1 Tax=Haladaptatus sp. DJG-WS-42 TaxID=3120516 RepID=UPI0030CE87AE